MSTVVSRRPGKVKSTVSAASTPTEEFVEADGLVPLALTAEQRATLVVVPGDVVFVDDARWWLGGLRSARCRVSDEVAPTPDLALPTGVMDQNKWLPGVRVVLSRVD